MAMPTAIIDEAIRLIREAALRQAMAMVNRLQPDVPALFEDEGQQTAFRLGHQHARMQVYDEIERMIAREVPAPDVAARDDDGGC